MTKQNEGTTGQAILSAITSEGNAGSKAQPLITAAIKAGDKAAFVAVATGLDRVKDQTKRKALFAILRTRMRRGSKAAELPVVWTVKRQAEGGYTVLEKEPTVADEGAKLRKALELVVANITDPEVSVRIMTALQAATSPTPTEANEVTAQH